MAVRRILAQATVSDLDAAVSWYTKGFGRNPDTNPMPGLIEWHLADTFGVQIWLEPDRAGRGCIVLEETDLDGLASILVGLRIASSGPEQAMSSRIFRLEDPDGNRVVFTGV